MFAYGVDNSDKPSYLLWPIRGVNGQFLLVDPWSGNYFAGAPPVEHDCAGSRPVRHFEVAGVHHYKNSVEGSEVSAFFEYVAENLRPEGLPRLSICLDLEAAKFMEPIGFEHFFDAFALDWKRSLKVDAAAALHIPLNDVPDFLVVKQDRANRFELTPVWAPVEPQAKRAKTAEVRLSSASDVPMPPRSDDNAKGSSDEEASDSSGSNSNVSSKMILRMFLIWRNLFFFYFFSLLPHCSRQLLSIYSKKLRTYLQPAPR